MLFVDFLLELGEVVLGVVDGKQAAQRVLEHQQPEIRMVGSTQLVAEDRRMLYIQSIYKNASETMV